MPTGTAFSHTTGILALHQEGIFLANSHFVMLSNFRHGQDMKSKISPLIMFSLLPLFRQLKEENTKVRKVAIYSISNLLSSKLEILMNQNYSKISAMEIIFPCAIKVGEVSQANNSEKGSTRLVFRRSGIAEKDSCLKS